MPASTMTAREFNQHVSRAKKAASKGPLIITERGKPAYVLMRHDEFIAGAQRRRAIDVLSDPTASDDDVAFPRLGVALRAPDLS
jgi:PHD/YefM family antitoxin component YafN of YafNO toxin-antitoxin module